MFVAVVVKWHTHTHTPKAMAVDVETREKIEKQAKLYDAEKKESNHEDPEQR